MTTAAHTPGPWVLCVQDDDDRAHTVFAESQLKNGQIDAANWDDAVACAGLNHKNFKANARLIAAAPDLLAAAQAFVRYDHDGIHENDHAALMLVYAEALKLCKEAIARATGSAA